MDDEGLIAKKEVLQETGISYGQLYRWKRKGLIPESWFVRRSTFTGQETFFPRDKILERIERIKEMKEDHPLDDLADVITKQVNAKLQVAFNRLKDLKWLDAAVLESCDVSSEDKAPLSMHTALCLGVLSRIRDIARPEESDLVRRTLEQHADDEFLERVSDRTLQLYLLRKQLSGGGISAEISLVVLAEGSPVFDPDIKQVGVVDLRNLLERIKLDLARHAEGSEAVRPEEE